MGAFFISNNLKDDGSLLVVPGSHKSNYKLEFKKYIAHELPGSMPVEGNAGDVLLFSECLLHMGNKKFTKGERINLYYLYSIVSFFLPFLSAFDVLLIFAAFFLSS